MVLGWEELPYAKLPKVRSTKLFNNKLSEAELAKLLNKKLRKAKLLKLEDTTAKDKTNEATAKNKTATDHSLVVSMSVPD